MQARRPSVFGVANWLHVSFAKCDATTAEEEKIRIFEQSSKYEQAQQSVHENDSGVEDASGMESDVEERHVENLIEKYL